MLGIFGTSAIFGRYSCPEERVLPLRPLPHIREYSSAEEAARLLRDPKIQAVFRWIRLDPFAQELRDYTARRDLLCPDNLLPNKSFRSLLASPELLAHAFRRGLERTGFPAGQALDELADVLQSVSSDIAHVAGVRQIFGHASVRTRAMMRARASERQLEELNYIELPLYGMWNPELSKLVSPAEEGVNRPWLHHLQRDHRNEKWRTALFEERAPIDWYRIPEQAFVIAKGARTIGNVDPGRIGTSFACGDPWLFRYLPLAPRERTFHVRWMVTEVPPFFQSPLAGVEL